jgi:hypothetical protein
MQVRRQPNDKVKKALLFEKRSKNFFSLRAVGWDALGHPTIAWASPTIA